MELYFSSQYKYFQLIIDFRGQVRADLDNCLSYLQPYEADILRSYYRHMQNLPSTGAVWLAEMAGFCRRLTPILEEMDKRTEPIRILDAGCGLATFSLLFSHMGASVLGVDLREERLSVAKKRIQHYQANGYLKGSIELRLQNIFKTLNEAESPERKFDAIWAHEAISHIDPAEEFLKKAAYVLKEGGLIVISDGNKLNPLVQLSHLKQRGLKIRTKRRDPETGIMVSYTNERAFSPAEMKHLLENSGFQECVIITHSFIPYTMRKFPFGETLIRIDEFLRRFSLLTSLAGSYTITARKRSSII